ncbi:dihydroxyacetone kinase subunit DhaL [Streptomonospora nanhaiensis]|uniref:Dihydroxyacetone kinase-like protein n=1 Tax=Streptomonospora nanhaiensis TaxID=1323731 RepID=A0A853BLP1_9ACTN|nr:dihydroxyacetone kinase subunit DhaL [Streptomonospora nanhaiensis]MBV2363277.1 dihydroxyacetone kinase subunit L [Streptomonospora nanhaiensis]MBX9389903.1 dihydroxyacetone kinase subunit L [Streptomonospora nanhaiensis]NYI95635.1 dihydroxyacetone kinase-like protein [Streptomonospora nanhaiensis]
MDIELARAWVRAVAVAVEKNREHLSDLDAAIGDGDHGANLNRGFAAAAEAVEALQPETVGAVLVKAGTTLVSKVGGASGPLYGSALRAAGKRLTGASADPAEVAAALAAGLEEVRRLGGAQPGDKTMVDAYTPAVEAFTAAAERGAALAEAAQAAATAAEDGARATEPLQARKGRASYLGERSKGHEDPGAASTALVFRALADTAAAAG